MTDPLALARSRRSCLVAPAGYGKTQIIAQAVVQHGGSRELILTHTHAGVDALRRRLRTLEADRARNQIDTIAGWTLGYASSFPTTSGIGRDFTPSSSDQWNAVYDGARRLLDNSAIRRIVECSYSGIYVDEYQDCTIQQHNVVVALANLIPCR